MRPNLALTIAFTLTAMGTGLAQGADAAGESNGIPYVSGGVGSDAREEMLAKQSDYNLMVMLVLADGHYLGGGEVALRDRSGKTLLSIDAEGPWVFAKLPAGSYTVEGRAGDVKRTARCVIGKKGLRRVVLTWSHEPS